MQLDFAYSLDCFRNFGIYPRSSEACGYGGRRVVDLDSMGIALMQEYLGGWVTFTPLTSLDGQYATMMFPHDGWTSLAVFILIREGHEIVVSRKDGVVMGYTDSEWMEMKDRYLSTYVGTRVYVNRGTAGTRNVHMWTGRTT